MNVRSLRIRFSLVFVSFMAHTIFIVSISFVGCVYLCVCTSSPYFVAFAFSEINILIFCLSPDGRIQIELSASDLCVRLSFPIAATIAFILLCPSPSVDATVDFSGIVSFSRFSLLSCNDFFFFSVHKLNIFNEKRKTQNADGLFKVIKYLRNLLL